MIPLCLEPADWPELDRELWARACAPRRFLEPARPASLWTPARRRIVEQAYGQWLSWLASEGHLDTQRPGLRVVEKRVIAFVHQLSKRVSSTSVSMMMGAFQRMMVALEPAVDWAWLRSIAQDLKANATPERNRLPHMVEPQQLYKLGLSLMQQASGQKLPIMEREDELATMARDGLMIAMLVCCPIRIRNLTELSIGQLQYDGERECYWIKLSEGETKTGVGYEAEYPRQLTTWIDWYLRGPRKLMLSQGRHQTQTRRLWVTRHGAAMAAGSIRDQIKKRTAKAFARGIWPHLFRAIAATGIVDFAPDKIAIAQDLLGHSRVATTERYYILARGTAAHHEVQTRITDLRAEARSALGTGHSRSTYVRRGSRYR